MSGKLTFKLACSFCAVALNRIGKWLLLGIFLGQNDSNNFSYFLMDKRRGEYCCLVHMTLIQGLGKRMFIVSCGLTSAAPQQAILYVSACLLFVKKLPSPYPLCPCSEGNISFFKCANILSWFTPKLTVKHFNKNDLGVRCLKCTAVKISSTDYSNIHQSVRQSLSLVQVGSIFPLLVSASHREH